MCTEVFVKDKVLETPRELKENGFDVLPEDCYGSGHEDMCLCGWDVETILERSGVVYTRVPGGFEVSP